MAHIQAAADRSDTRKSLLLPVIISNVFCIIVSIIFFAPLFLMFINSMKTNDEVMANPAGLPIIWTLAEYFKVLDPNQALALNFLNSVIIAVVSTVLSSILCAAAAFSFAKLKFRGRSILFVVLMVTMMVPMEVTVPGLYLIFAKFGLINTLTGLILPTISPIVGLFLIRQYMHTVPDEIIDAARIDGASTVTIFFRIVLPMVMPIVGAFAVLHFIYEWNDYLWPSLIATQADVQPLMVALPQLVDPIIGSIPAYGTIMAGCVLSFLPLIGVFLLFRRTILSSVVIGAVK